MKKYKIEYWDVEKIKPYCLLQISKSGKWDGVMIFFFSIRKKDRQAKYKNGLLNGFDKHWWSNSTNWHCRNWKKGKTQGIQIIFN